MSRSGALELRVPPPVVALVALALMWLVASLLPWRIAVPDAGWIGGACAALGFSIEAAGIAFFLRVRTTPNPMRPERASTLVTGGPYRFTRNPMYLGWLPVLLGWAIALQSPASLLVVPLFAAYLTRFQILPEERALRAKFGAAFDAYAARVPRWL